MRSALVYCEKYLEFAFTPPSLRWNWTERNRLFMRLFERYGLDEYVDVVEPLPASEEELMLVHDRKYVDYVKEISKRGVGYLDYGDTPAYRGVYEDAALAFGGTSKLVDLVLEGRYRSGFNMQGGFHHARRDSAAGFCVFNDVALAALKAHRRGLRVAVVDVDGHHGDGTQSILYREPVLKISIHKYGYGFYPGTGDVDELGEGEGLGYSVNIPLPHGAGDDALGYALEEVVKPLLEKYEPEFLVLQMGADGHLGDPLVGLRLTSISYRKLARELKRIANEYAEGRIVGLGGGGYDPEATARMWMITFCEIAEVPQELRDGVYGDLRDGVEGTASSPRVLDVVRDRVKRLKKSLRDLEML